MYFIVKFGKQFNFPIKIMEKTCVFANTAVHQLKFRSAGMQDATRSCLHIIHASNTSIAFPQQILPAKSLPILFPKFHSSRGAGHAARECLLGPRTGKKT